MLLITLKKYWDTNKLQILMYLNCLYAINFQCASTFALEKCDQPTKNLDVLRPSSLHRFWLTWFDGKTRTESVFLKKWLSNPLKKGHCNQRCAAAWSHSLPHPALIEVNEDFIVDFVGTDSSPPSVCQHAFKVPSSVLHPSQELNSDQEDYKTNIAVTSRPW